MKSAVELNRIAHACAMYEAGERIIKAKYPHGSEARRELRRSLKEGIKTYLHDNHSVSLEVAVATLLAHCAPATTYPYPSE